MQPEENEDIPLYHESPSMTDISPDDERFLMNLSDIVGSGRLKPKGLLFDSDEDESPPPLTPFEIYEDV